MKKKDEYLYASGPANFRAVLAVQENARAALQTSHQNERRFTSTLVTKRDDILVQDINPVQRDSLNSKVNNRYTKLEVHSKLIVI